MASTIILMHNFKIMKIKLIEKMQDPCYHKNMELWDAYNSNFEKIEGVTLIREKEDEIPAKNNPPEVCAGRTKGKESL
jgi:hypothetical protein